jgi:hypothetical protein
MKQEVAVELYYAGAWHEVTARDEVYTAQPITISRTGFGTSRTSKLTLSLKNVDGRYSPRNPNSELYGLIGRNTPIRVMLGDDVRFTGEVESWPVEWSVTGAVVWSAITAYGIRHRLAVVGSRRPARSALRRAIDADPIRPVAYWPLEGGSGSLKLYDTVRNLPTEQVDQSAAVAGQSGAVRFGTVVLGDGSDLVANVAGSWTLGMPIRPAPLGTGAFAFQFTLNYGVEVRSGNSTVVGLRLDPAINTNHAYWLVYLDETGSGHVDVIIADRDFGVVTGPTSLTTFNAGNVFDGRPRVFEFAGTASGAAGVAWTLKVNDVTVASGTYASGVTGVLNAGPWRLGALCTAGADAIAAIGHCVAYQVASGFTARYLPALGNIGEPAGDRIVRVLAEDGATCTLIDSTAALGGELLGPQKIATTLDIVDQAAESDGGILYEDRDALAMTYRTNDSFNNAEIVVELDYADKQVTPPLKPTEDTSRVANIVTVNREGGAAYTARQDAGTLNTNDPTTDPNGVGGYPADPTLSLIDDDTPQQQAYYRLHHGTWDQARYETVPINIEAIEDTLELDLLVAQINALDIGDRFTIINPPAWLPPETIDMLAQGYVETIDTHGRTIDVDTIPAGPWVVTGVWAGDGTFTTTEASHYSPDGSELAADAGSGDVTLYVDTPSGPLWTTDAEDLPLDIIVGGEVIRVTAIAAAGAAAVAFESASAANSGTGTSSSFAATIDAAAQIGSLGVLWVAQNGTQAITSITAPSGNTWTQFAQVTTTGNNCRLTGYTGLIGTGDPGASLTVAFAAAQRVATSVETFSGSGGVDTSGTNSNNTETASLVCPDVTAAAAGSMLVTAVASRNSVAGTVLTHSPPGGTTERADTSTTAAGSVNIGHTAGSKAVGAGATGTTTYTPSANASFAGISLILAPAGGGATEQAFTVVRSVNGITKAHTAGAAVELNNAPRYARSR